MPRKKIQRKAKKGKTSIKQTVIVNVSKRGGSGAKRPPQPPQAIQLLQAITPLLSQKPMLQSGQPLFSSQQQLEQLINLLEKRPSPNIVVNAPQGLQGEPGPAGRQGARGFPAPMPEVSLEDVRRVARGIIPPSERSGVSSWATPSIESLSPRSLKSFAFDFDNASLRSGQSYVLDLPDVPLIQPAQPAVSGAPIRLDDPHEDAPVDEYVAEEKEPAKTLRDYALEYADPQKVNRLKRNELRKLAELMRIPTHMVTPTKQRAWKPINIFKQEINEKVASLLGLPK